MQSKQRSHLMAAITVAIALSFAGALSASVYPVTAAEEANPEIRAVTSVPFQYFPDQYQNQATEIEPLPPQF